MKIYIISCPFQSGIHQYQVNSDLTCFIVPTDVAFKNVSKSLSFNTTCLSLAQRRGKFSIFSELLSCFIWQLFFFIYFFFLRETDLTWLNC